MPNFKPTDSKADEDNGTLVREVNANTDPVAGFLKEQFGQSEALTVQWNVRNSLNQGSLCPVWIHKVVVSDTLDGARKGKSLALQPEGSDPDPSSSSSSEQVHVLAVDANGAVKAEKVFKFSLVSAIQGDPPAGQMAIASELLVSMEAIDTSKNNLAIMANRCNQHQAGKSTFKQR